MTRSQQTTMQKPDMVLAVQVAAAAKLEQEVAVSLVEKAALEQAKLGTLRHPSEPAQLTPRSRKLRRSKIPIRSLDPELDLRAMAMRKIDQCMFLREVRFACCVYKAVFTKKELLHSPTVNVKLKFWPGVNEAWRASLIVMLLAAPHVVDPSWWLLQHCFGITMK